MNRRLSALWDEGLFSARTFAGALLALFIAFSLDLPRPSWAMATVYIVTQPLSGALRSKAVYRVGGTLLGAAVTLGLIPALVNASELLSIAMALWVGICLYFSLLDRTPRSYLFMLAGYSAALIGFPSVADPSAIFDVALARVEEITLGVLCATLAGGVVFHRPVGPVLSARLDAWLRDAGRLSLDALDGRRDDEETRADRRRLAADAVELHMLASQLAYDTSLLQGTTRWVHLLQRRMVTLLPLLSSITDGVATFRRSGGEFLAPQQSALTTLKAWIEGGQDTPRAVSLRLRNAIAQLESGASLPANWNAILLGSIFVRLREFVEVTQDCRDLRGHIAAGGQALPPRRLAQRARAGALLHRDHGMALLSAFAAVLAVLLCCLFWIASSWPEGGVAAQMGAVACCLFASQDDPVPGIVDFIRAAAIALLIVAVYLFAVMPAIDGFPMLAIVLATAFLPIGLLIAKPRWGALAAPLAVNAVTLMNLQNRYNADLAGFLNNGLAMVLGIGVAAIVTGIVRSVGAEWSAHRLLRACWADLAAVAARPGNADRTAFAGRMLDRLGMLAPRLAAVALGADVAAADTLTDIRIGLDILDLQRLRQALPRLTEQAVAEMLHELVQHFRNRSIRHTQTPLPRLLWFIDRALARANTVAPGRRKQRLLAALADIRCGLFPEAPSYAPASPPSTNWQAAA